MQTLPHPSEQSDTPVGGYRLLQTTNNLLAYPSVILTGLLVTGQLPSLGPLSVTSHGRHSLEVWATASPSPGRTVTTRTMLTAKSKLRWSEISRLMDINHGTRQTRQLYVKGAKHALSLRAWALLHGLSDVPRSTSCKDHSAASCSESVVTVSVLVTFYPYSKAPQYLSAQGQWTPPCWRNPNHPITTLIPCTAGTDMLKDFTMCNL